MDNFARRVYRHRVAQRELKNRLARSGAVLIEGARAAGKTVLARRVAASRVMLDADRSARRAAESARDAAEARVRELEEELRRRDNA